METTGAGEATALGRRRGVVIVTIVTLVVALTGAAFALRSDGPPVINLAGGGGGDETLAVAEMADDAARADLTMWSPVVYRFELRDGARFGAGEADAWQLVPPGDLEAAANELAARFGFGSVTPSPYDESSFTAGPDDGSGPMLWVGAAGDWSFHDPDDRVVWDCVEPALPEPDRDEAGDDDIAAADSEAPDAVEEFAGCEMPEPPSGVPSASEARSLAEALFADLTDTGEVSIADVYADEWSAWVSGSIALDGMATDLSVSGSWGGDAQLTSVSGTLAVPTRADTYPTIDADAAVQRLTEQGYGWGRLAADTMPVPEATIEPEVAVDPDSTVSSDDVVSDDGVADEPLPVDPEMPEPLPLPDPDAEPEEVTVTLVSVEPVLMLQWSADGTTWLLPGYRFTDEEGGIWQVLSIADEYLETDVPEEILPAPEPGVEPPPGEGVDGADPEPTDQAPSSPGEGEPGTEPEPGADGSGADLQEAAHAVIGLPEDDATAKLEEMGAEVRIVARDGENFPVTDDYREDRINLTVDDGVVVDATIG